MVISKDKAFIMAVDDEKIQTIYALFQDDLSTVRLAKLWSSNNIVKIIIRHDSEKQEEKVEKIGIYFINTNDGCTFVTFV
jgi:hypothetical protein